VHEADLNDGRYVRGEAPGIDLAIKALEAAIPDDNALLERGMALFDGLYKVLRRRAE
jgi:hypothetical protein